MPGSVDISVNGTDFVNSPISEIFEVFTDLFSNAFFLIPLTFIAVALYYQTRNMVAVSSYMLGVGLLFGSSNIFTGYGEMAFIYYVFSGIGLVGLVLNFFFMRRT